jgi:hypothetical protein
MASVMEELRDQGLFLFSEGDTTINLVPAFSVYLLGVAAFAALAVQVVDTDFLASRSAPAQIPPDNKIPELQQPQQQLQQYYQPAPTGQQQQYYQPTAGAQQDQEQYYQQYQQEYYQQLQQQEQQPYGQNFNPAIVEKQDYTNSQEQVDIYRKLVNLQEELRKLQEAEKLLSTALSRRYTNVA